MVIDKPQCGLDTCKYYFDGNCTNEKRYRTCEFAYFKQLEATGRLIELPCKVGDTVWYIEEMKSYTPLYHSWYECLSFRIGYIEIAEKWLAFGRDGSGMFTDIKFHGKDIGKTVFLTKEEAEAKLKELKGE